MTLVFVLFSILVVQGAGYLVHRAAHWRGGGALYRAHMAHHERLYPAADFLSSTYRLPPAGQSSVLGFLPYLLILMALAALALPGRQALVFGATAIAVGWLNSALHDALHLRGHWLERHRWFLRLRALHYQHHLDMRTNLSVFSWFWDRVAGSYRDARTQPGDLAPPPTRAIGPSARCAKRVMGQEFLVVTAVGDGSGSGHLEVRTVFATSAHEALDVCRDARPGARRAVPLEGEVLALWNELGRAAFGFGA